MLTGVYANSNTRSSSTNESANADDVILWQDGYVQHYIILYNVRPCRVFFDYIMRTSEWLAAQKYRVPTSWGDAVVV